MTWLKSGGVVGLLMLTATTACDQQRRPVQTTQPAVEAAGGPALPAAKDATGAEEPAARLVDSRTTLPVPGEETKLLVPTISVSPASEPGIRVLLAPLGETTLASAVTARITRFNVSCDFSHLKDFAGV